jgi:hypothetical protein
VQTRLGSRFHQKDMEVRSQSVSLPPDLSPAKSKIALRLGSKAKAARHLPSVALNRNSFIVAWREPLSVSTRGRPNCGPSSSRRSDSARISDRTYFVQSIEFRRCREDAPRLCLFDRMMRTIVARSIVEGRNPRYVSPYHLEDRILVAFGDRNYPLCSTSVLLALLR